MTLDVSEEDNDNDFDKESSMEVVFDGDWERVKETACESVNEAVGERVALSISEVDLVAEPRVCEID